MTRTTLVSLVSDQTIPNVLFIKDQAPADNYLFVSTKIMEEKGIVSNIIKACEEKVQSFATLLVEEDNMEDIKTKLNGIIDFENEHFIVNITGGTKVMSLGVFDFFSKNTQSLIYYLPLGKNKILQLHPEINSYSLNFRIDLEDYLIANGVVPESRSFQKKNTLLKKADETQKLYSEFSTESNHILKQAAEHFRKYRNNDKIQTLELNIEEKWYLQPFLSAGFKPEIENSLSRQEIKYCTGDWFEEYIYNLIKSIKEKNNEEIGVGVSLTRNKVRNEFDVIFTHNNALYVIECKTDIANEEGKFAELFNNTLYKAGSLRKDFGLFVKFYLFSINDFSKLSNEKRDRARVLDIHLVGTEILNDREKLVEFISKM